ncbi:MAG: hypothetical protein EBX99_09510 [Acidimicrobiia bacterium]|nr:hypothetical protein [Acidimicrobiia bacterium]
MARPTASILTQRVLKPSSCRHPYILVLIALCFGARNAVLFDDLGDGIAELIDYITSRLPDGPQYYPDDVVSDLPEAEWVAELVREQLLAVFRDELPYSIATRVTEWEWPRIRCEIVVERESQKGMVIGKGGSVLKNVGILVRKQLPEGVFLELHVVVDKDWQQRPDRVERLGY